MSAIKGLREFRRKLNKLEAASQGKILRSAALAALLPAKKEAERSAPRGSPPYGPYRNRGPIDPYPKKTYKGRLVFEGFASRNIARKTKLSRDKKYVKAMLGVKPEAFYALSFVELGTSKIRKRPWLEPAFRRSRQKMLDRFGKILRDRIAKASR